MLLLGFAVPRRRWQLLAELGIMSAPPGNYTRHRLPAGPFQHLSATAKIIAISLIVPAG